MSAPGGGRNVGVALWWEAIRRDRKASVGVAIIGLFVVLGLIGPWLVGSADALFDNLDGGHADERETSVMLALEPRSVRMDRLAPEGDFKTTAATGDASRASAFKGERLLAARVDDMVAALARRWPGAF